MDTILQIAVALRQLASRFFYILSITFPLLVSLPACMQGSYETMESDDTALLLLFVAAANQTQTAQTESEATGIINDGLRGWQIGLTTNLTAADRYMGDAYHASNPENWISVVDDQCLIEGRRPVGVPDGLIDSCAFTGTNVIGLCSFLIWGSGDIAESTILLHRGYLEGRSSRAQKVGVVIHEIGHCVGLPHQPHTDYIMRPYAGITQPHPRELEAVHSAYNPLGDVSAAIRDEFFFYYDPGDGSRRTVRHHAMPDFVTSGEIVPASSGNSFRAEFLQQTEAPYLTPGADIDRSQMHEFTYYIMEDGRELMRYRPAGCSSQRGCR